MEKFTDSGRLGRGLKLKEEHTDYTFHNGILYGNVLSEKYESGKDYTRKELIKLIYTVEISPDAVHCDCYDFKNYGLQHLQICKHIVAVLSSVKDEHVRNECLSFIEKFFKKQRKINGKKKDLTERIVDSAKEGKIRRVIRAAKKLIKVEE